MIRVVLDTNVLVAAVISPTGPNSQVFDLITALAESIAWTASSGERLRGTHRSVSHARWVSSN